MRRLLLAAVAGLTAGAALTATPHPAIAQTPPPAAAPPAFVQTSADEYTRYELLDPGSAKFRILYDVTAATPGAPYYFNGIRRGSEASDEAVYDRASGEPLRFEVVSGERARFFGFTAAGIDQNYIMVHLTRPVPGRGEARIRIDKTYRDPESYFVEGDVIVFSRSLGIRKNAVVLPAGYELVSCNYPSQVLTEADGRIKVSFINTGAASVPLVLKARRLP